MTVRQLAPSGKNVPVQQKPSSPLVALQNEVNRVFNSFFGESSWPRWWHGVESAFGATPALDVCENSKSFTISAEIPGMDAKDVQVTVADGYLTVQGEKKEETKEEKEGYFRQERSYGSFQRMVQLPNAADMDKAEARIEKGVLTVTVPKKPESQTKERRIDVKEAA
jgi:HSP20 family protein